MIIDGSHYCNSDSLLDGTVGSALLINRLVDGVKIDLVAVLIGPDAGRKLSTFEETLTNSDLPDLPAVYSFTPKRHGHQCWWKRVRKSVETPRLTRALENALREKYPTCPAENTFGIAKVLFDLLSCLPESRESHLTLRLPNCEDKVVTFLLCTLSLHWKVILNDFGTTDVDGTIDDIYCLTVAQSLNISLEQLYQTACPHLRAPLRASDDDDDSYEVGAKTTAVKLRSFLRKIRGSRAYRWGNFIFISKTEPPTRDIFEKVAIDGYKRAWLV